MGWLAVPSALDKYFADNMGPLYLKRSNKLIAIIKAFLINIIYYTFTFDSHAMNQINTCSYQQ